MKWVPLENNPDVLSAFAYRLGLSHSLAFHDVYSLDPEVRSFLPDPVLALLLVFPITERYESAKREQDAGKQAYDGLRGPSATQVMWYKQTIGNACGTMALLHAISNGPARKSIASDSPLGRLLPQLQTKDTNERIQLIEGSRAIEDIHAAIAQEGATAPPPAEDEVDLHFVCFVKGDDGTLYELDGRRVGPIAHTKLNQKEDMLSPKAVEIVRQFIDRSSGGLSFSLCALA